MRMARRFSFGTFLFLTVLGVGGVVGYSYYASQSLSAQAVSTIHSIAVTYAQAVENGVSLQSHPELTPPQRVQLREIVSFTEIFDEKKSSGDRIEVIQALQRTAHEFLRSIGPDQSSLAAHPSLAALRKEFGETGVVRKGIAEYNNLVLSLRNNSNEPIGSVLGPVSKGNKLGQLPFLRFDGSSQDVGQIGL